MRVGSLEEMIRICRTQVIDLFTLLIITIIKIIKVI